jgi:predicted neutral ceramidase superfamily lipid hydrolase
LERFRRAAKFIEGARMRATLLFRISSVIFIIFALGHTFGFLSFKPATAEGMAVRQAMNDVVFKFNGSELSYGKFYRGFGLSCTVSMLFLSILCWQLGNLAAVRPREIVVVAWALVGMQVLGVVFSVKYFGLPPTICSVALTALLGWAALLVTRAA